MRPDWTKLKHEQRLVAIKAAMAPGKTAEEIALAFERATRNSIIGFCNRNKIDLPNKRPKGRQKKPSPKRTPAPPRAKASPRPPIGNTVSVPLPKIETEPKQTTSVPFGEIERGQCRWPLWDRFDTPETSMCCGARRVEGSPYCENHAARSVGRGTESERTADRILERYA